MANKPVYLNIPMPRGGGNMPYSGAPRPGSIEELRARQSAQLKAQPQPFNPASLLPAVGGTIGTIGGAILGGPVGAGIGGALGGGAGSALEQAIGGKGVDIGKVGQEAAISGVLGYGPLRALGLVTGTRGLGRAIAGRAFGEVAGQAGVTGVKAAPKYSQALASAWGIDKNIKVAGARLGESRAAQLQQFVSKVAQPVKFKSATNVQSELEKFSTSVGQKIGSSLKTPKVVEVKTVQSELNNAFRSIPGIGVAKKGVLNTTANDISKQVAATEGNTAKLWAYRKTLQKKINHNLTAGNAEGTDQMVLHKSVDVINNILKNEHKNLGKLFSDYHNANKAIEAMVKPSMRPGGVPLPGTLGKNVPMTGKAWQAAQAEAALAGKQVAPKAVQAGGRAVSPAQMSKLEQALRYGGRGRAPLVAGGPAEKVAGIKALGPLGVAKGVGAALPSAVKRQALAAIVGGKFNLGTAEPTITNEQSLTDVSNNIPVPETMNPYPIENMMYDVSRDPKNANKYINMFNAIQANIKTQSKGKALTATQAQKAGSAMNALQDIPMLVDAIQTGKLGLQQAIPGANTPAGQRLLGTADIQSAMFNITDNVLRARTGAAMPESEIRRYMQYLMPNPFDSQEVQLSKLNRLVDELKSYVNPPTSSMSAEDLLAQVQGG